MAQTTDLRHELELGGRSTPEAHRLRHIGVLISIGLVAAALVPGVLIRVGAHASIPGEPGLWLAALERELGRIEFGAGVRFWLGIAGAGMLAMLLLYPLRKLMGLTRLVSITAWFNLHVVVGLVGPALILYHTNFGLGSRPANVALFTTLIVAVSGLTGYFLYTRYSAMFYRIKAHGRASLESAIASLGAMESGPTKDRLIEDLRQFDQRMLEERRGLIASTRSRGAIRAFERDAFARAAYLIESQGSALPSARRHELRRSVASHLRRYFALVRRSERWSIYERLWAKWRLMHLPVFAITVIAATIHVIKVWDIDSPRDAASNVARQQRVADAGAAARSHADARSPPATPLARPDSPLTVRPIRTMAMPAEMDGSAAPAPVLLAKPTLAARPHRATSEASPELIAASPATDTRSALPSSTTAGPDRSRIAAAADAAAPPPPTAAQSPTPPATAQKQPGGADAAIAELARRSAADNRGRFDPATLARRLAELKEQNFDHGRTDFPLTGKHAKAKCESCHKATLKDNKKECIACHKKEDVHKGRRPECAQCHTTVNWTELIRK